MKNINRERLTKIWIGIILLWAISLVLFSFYCNIYTLIAVIITSILFIGIHYILIYKIERGM